MKVRRDGDDICYDEAERGRNMGICLLINDLHYFCKLLRPALFSFQCIAVPVLAVL